MNEKTDSKPDPRTSRRNFLMTPAGAGAIAVAISTPGQLFAGTSATIPTISIPKEIPATLSEAPKVGSFEGRGMTGAEVFAKLCKEEDLAAMFCCPGNYTVINAIDRPPPRARGRDLLDLRVHQRRWRDPVRHEQGRRGAVRPRAAGGAGAPRRERRRG